MGGHPIHYWVGGAGGERGGAGVRFESCLDDMTSVDLRGVKRVAMFALELLHRTERWEALVDIGLRLDALTGYDDMLPGKKLRFRK